MGIGDSRIPVNRTQPTGSVNCAKPTDRLAAGEPQANFAPTQNRPAHGSVAQWGRSPAPGLEKVGHPGLGAASSRAEDAANGGNIGVLKAGCPTFVLADGKRKVRGAVFRVDKGVQPAKPCVALATEERLCHVAH